MRKLIEMMKEKSFTSICRISKMFLQYQSVKVLKDIYVSNMHQIKNLKKKKQRNISQSAGYLQVFSTTPALNICMR